MRNANSSNTRYKVFEVLCCVVDMHQAEPKLEKLEGVPGKKTARLASQRPEPQHPKIINYFRQYSKPERGFNFNQRQLNAAVQRHDGVEQDSVPSTLRTKQAPGRNTQSHTS